MWPTQGSIIVISAPFLVLDKAHGEEEAKAQAMASSEALDLAMAVRSTWERDYGSRNQVAMPQPKRNKKGTKVKRFLYFSTLKFWFFSLSLHGLRDITPNAPEIERPHQVLGQAGPRLGAAVNEGRSTANCLQHQERHVTTKSVGALEKVLPKRVDYKKDGKWNAKNWEWLQNVNQ